MISVWLWYVPTTNIISLKKMSKERWWRQCEDPHTSQIEWCFKSLLLYIYNMGSNYTWRKSIRSSWCKNYAILPRQMPTLLFYHIILQHLIYQIFYNSILYIKIHYFGLPNLSIPLQICNRTDTKWYMCQIYATYATSAKELFFVFGVGYVRNI